MKIAAKTAANIAKMTAKIAKMTATAMIMNIVRREDSEEEYSGTLLEVINPFTQVRSQ